MGKTSKKVQGTVLNPDYFMRVGYCIMLLVFALVMFIVGNFGYYIFTWVHDNIQFVMDLLSGVIPYKPEDWMTGINECEFGDNPIPCYNKLGVFRFSLPLFLFHIGLAIVTIPSAWRWKGREYMIPIAKILNYRLWWIKMPLLLIALLVGFFLPNFVFYVWGQISRVLAGGFIFIQIILLIDFAYNLNEFFVKKDKMVFYVLVIIFSIVFYVITAVFTILSYGLFCWFWNAPIPFCFHYFLAITVNILLIVILSVISILKWFENGAILTAATVSLYTSYIILSGLSNDDTACSLFNRIQTVNDAGGIYGLPVSPQLFIGLFIMLISVWYSTFRASSKGDAFTLQSSQDDYDFDDGEGSDDGEDQDFQEPKYQYTFFHLVFALAYCYVSMLLISWNIDAEPAGRYAVDKGWISVWVRIVSTWVTWMIYFWTLIAPFVIFWRRFGEEYEEGGDDDFDF